MAGRAYRVCTVNGCPELTRSGKCDAHKKQASRNRTPERVSYGPRWRRVRDAFIKRYPVCFHCGARATQVDHIDGLGINGPRAFDWSNLQSLCTSCHGKKGYRENGLLGNWAADGKRLAD